MLPHTPISQPVSHEEADETELEQRRGQGWKCEAGMSNWKGDNHKNMHISCYVTILLPEPTPASETHH